MLDPHLPGFLGDAFVNLLAERMTLKWNLVQAFHFLLELHAENLARPRTNCVLDLIEVSTTATASHKS